MTEFVFKKNIYNIYGKNAQGKTNLLESIFITSYFRSFRTRQIRNCINYEKDYFKIKNVYENEITGEEHAIIFKLYKNEKQVLIDNKKLSRLSDGYGLFKVILFSPYDFNLFSMGPNYRRRFFDMFISSIDKQYLITLIKYKEIWKKIRLLLQSDMVDEQLLQIYEDMLKPYSSKIREKRKGIIQKINEKLHDHCLGIYKQEKPFIKYLEKGTGPHIDDFEFLINEKNLEKFGSQGQKRTFLISLKLALLHLIEDETNEKPVFLMDDVFSELDRERQKNLIDLVEKMDLQVFITSVEKVNDSRLENIEIKWKN